MEIDGSPQTVTHTLAQMSPILNDRNDVVRLRSVHSTPTVDHWSWRCHCWTLGIWGWGNTQVYTGTQVIHGYRALRAPKPKQRCFPRSRIMGNYGGLWVFPGIHASQASDA